MRTKLYKLMMAQDPKKSGGGDGGEGGEGEPSLDDKIAAALEKALPKALNGVVTAHQKRLEAKLEERFKAIEARAPKGDDGEDEDGEGDGGEPAKPSGKPGALPPEVQKQLAAMQKRLEASEKRAAAEQAAREKAVAEGKTREERAALQDALIAAGVQKHMVKGAVALLYGEEKKLKRVADGDSEKVVWAEGDDELAIADGVKAWMKTEVGQSYLPARNVGGSGGTGGGGKGGGGGGGGQGATDQQVVDLLLGNSTPTATP